MPNVDKTCTTHHHACECREARFMILLNAAKAMLKNIDKWLETDIPATPNESKELIGNLRDAVKMLENNMPEQVFTAEEVESLKGFQECGHFHPFTCGNGHGNLTPTENGFFCERCDYTQDWAHEFMKDFSWKMK